MTLEAASTVLGAEKAAGYRHLGSHTGAFFRHASGLHGRSPRSPPMAALAQGQAVVRLASVPQGTCYAPITLFLGRTCDQIYSMW